MTPFDFNNLDEPLFRPPLGARGEALPEPPPWTQQEIRRPPQPESQTPEQEARATFGPGCWEDEIAAQAEEAQPELGSESAGTEDASPSTPQAEPATKQPPHGGRARGYHRVRPQDLGTYIGEVARLLFGSPNKERSSADQMRFGAQGSIAVETGGAKAGTYYNFEHKRGGGVIQLLAFEAGVIGPRANEWLRANIGIDIESEQRGKRFTDRIEATYDYRDESRRARLSGCSARRS